MWRKRERLKMLRLKKQKHKTLLEVTLVFQLLLVINIIALDQMKQNVAKTTC